MAWHWTGLLSGAELAMLPAIAYAGGTPARRQLNVLRFWSGITRGLGKSVKLSFGDFWRCTTTAAATRSAPNPGHIAPSPRWAGGYRGRCSDIERPVPLNRIWTILAAPRSPIDSLQRIFTSVAAPAAYRNASTSRRPSHTLTIHKMTDARLAVRRWCGYD